MSWKQVLSPNLDNDPNNPLYVWQGGQILTDWYGWCLAVTAASFGAKGSSYSAKTAWETNPTKHRDWNLPDRVWIPLWYEGGTYGHVVIGYREDNYITVYSSPYTHKATFEVFGGDLHGILEYIGNIYGVGGFSGWSETLLDSRIIECVADSSKPEPEPAPEPDPVEDNNDKDGDMTTPVQDQQTVPSIIEQAGSLFEFSDKTKMIAYIFGDFLLVGGLLVPSIISAIQAPTLDVFGEYLAKILLEAGVAVLMIFKLIKKKS